MHAPVNAQVDLIANVERKLYSNIYNYVNGTSKVRSHNDFINYFNGSCFLPINKTIVPSDTPLYDFMVNEGVYEVYFKANPSSAETVKIFYNSSRKDEKPHKTGFLTLQPMTLSYGNDLNQIQQIGLIKSINGIVDDNNLVYPNAFIDGVNLSYTYLASDLKEEIIIKANSTLPEPESYIISGKNPTVDVSFLLGFSDFLDIYINNTLWDKQTISVKQAQIDFKLNNETIYNLRPPYAFDANTSNPKYLGLTYELKYQKKKVYLKIKTSYEWLTKGVFERFGLDYNETSGEQFFNETMIWKPPKYPVTVDPSPSVARPTSDYSIGMPVVHGVGAEQETDYYNCSGYESEFEEWEHIPASPPNYIWLDIIGEGEYIKTKTDGARDGNYTFADASGFDSHSINEVAIQLYANKDGNDKVYLFVLYQETTYPFAWNWFDFGQIPFPNGYAWVTKLVTSKVNTWAEINNCKIYLEYDKVGGANYHYVDAARIRLKHTPPDPPHYQAVDEVSQDGDTTYVATYNDRTTYAYDLFYHGGFSLPENNTVDNVIITMYARTETGVSPYGGKGQTIVKVAGSTYVGVLHVLNYGTYTEYSTEYALSPKTSDTWGESEINNMVIGVKGRSVKHGAFPIYNQAYFTQVYIEIYYSPKKNVTFYFYMGINQLLVNGSNTANGTSNDYLENCILNITAVLSENYVFANHTYNGQNTTDNPFYLNVTQDFEIHSYADFAAVCIACLFIGLCVIVCLIAFVLYEVRGKK